MGLGIGLGFHGGGNVGVTVRAHGDHGFRSDHHRSRYGTGSHNHWKITIKIIDFFSYRNLCRNLCVGAFGGLAAAQRAA